jgi:AcrR family transcriptional regulator
MSDVPRWEPDAEHRLRAAAIELFTESGYSAVTIAQITDRAGLTRRTFFRYFADKREVLFPRSDDLSSAMTSALAALPASSDESVLAHTVLQVLAEAGEVITADREAQRRRARMIESSAELRERERSKLADTAAAIGQALTDNGARNGAMLGAMTMELFRAAYRSRIDDPAAGSFADHLERARTTLHRFFATP